MSVKSKKTHLWDSPISSSMIVESAVKLGDIVLDGDELYWNEIRPEEKGRSVIVHFQNGKCIDLLKKPYSARTRVHEYGGASFTTQNGTLYFSNFEDQGFYRQTKDGQVSPIITEKNKRYANPIFDEKRNVIYAIEEEHLENGTTMNRLVKIDESSNVLHEGHDFYSMPTLSPDGTRTAFLTWDHPNMPWDGTTLWVGNLSSDGSLTDLKQIAGGKDESIFQPLFSPDGTLYFVSDQSGFWNIYRNGDENCCPMNAEFAQPLWVFGMSNYGFLEDGRIAAIYTQKGTDFLGIIDPQTKTLETIDLPFTSYESFKVSKNVLYFVCASPEELLVLAKYEIQTKKLTRIQKSKELKIDPRNLSKPETLEFPTENNQTAYGFYYPPKNKNYEGIKDLPPLIVRSHGGPSGHANPILDLQIQFWTTRGFGFLDVNFGGSTGFGRAYRERLKGRWGIVDVDDCVNGALYLAKQRRIDRDRMIIKGGSSGGYTVLAALTFKDVFKGGVSYYGIADLEALVQETHKFEAHYMDGLIGPYPQEKKRYIQYSPIHHTDKISSPLLLLQGGQDKVVLPAQSEKLFKALKEKGVPVSYTLFEEEGHGFKSAANIKKALDLELDFYRELFEFV